MECTVRAALRADALAAPARTSWLCQPFALASPVTSPALRQRFALAPLFGSVHALCHTPPALRAGSAELLAGISASRCMMRSTALGASWPDLAPQCVPATASHRSVSHSARQEISEIASRVISYTSPPKNPAVKLGEIVLLK